MTKTAGKVIINFEATPEQRRQIREMAASFDLSQAEYLRQAATGSFLDMHHYAARGREKAKREREARK